MAQVIQLPPDPNQEILAAGVAGGGEGLGEFLVRRVRNRRLQEERRLVEEQIRTAADPDAALSIVENAPPEVRREFEPQLRETITMRFPEMEIIPVIGEGGQLQNITQRTGQPLSDEEIRGRGFEPARHRVLVSTDERGQNPQMLDTALDEAGSQEDLEFHQRLFPNRRFQTIVGEPAIEAFRTIVEADLERGRLTASREATEAQQGSITASERLLGAVIRQEISRDPLKTPDGLTILNERSDDIARQFENFNGKFEGDIFSLESPESASLVRGGMAIASTALARGAGFEEAMDIGFNNQIAHSIITNLLERNQPDSAVANEGLQRFGLAPADIKTEVEAMVEADVVSQLPEWNPQDEDTEGVWNTTGGVKLRVARIANRLVLLRKE